MYPAVEGDTTDFFSVTTTAVKLANTYLSLNALATLDSGSSIPFADKSVVSKLQLQGQKASFSAAGIHGSQDVKMQIVPIAVSAHEKSRPLTTIVCS